MQNSRNEKKTLEQCFQRLFGVQKLPLDEIDSLFFHHLFQKLIGVLSLHNAENSLGRKERSFS